MGSREANNLFRDARWSFLLNKIASDNALEVTDKDIQKQVVEVDNRQCRLPEG